MYKIGYCVHGHHRKSVSEKEHSIAVKCILKYLRKTKYILFVYRNGEIRVDGYKDSDFQSDIYDRISTREGGYNKTLFIS